MTERETRTHRHPVHLMHRIGAALVAGVLCVFAVLGLVGGLPLLATEGQPVLGMSSNGALSILSLVVAAILVTAALRGGPTASTVTTTLGSLFLLSGIAHLGIIHTPWNVLAFQLSNVFFSLVVGTLMLILGLYGRLSGGLPPDNPYRRARRTDPSKKIHSPDRTLDPPFADDAPELSRAEQAMGEGNASAQDVVRVRNELARQRIAERKRAYQHLREGHAREQGTTSARSTGESATERRNS